MSFNTVDIAQRTGGEELSRFSLASGGRLERAATVYCLDMVLLTLPSLFSPFSNIILCAGLMNPVACPCVGFTFNSLQTFFCMRAISIIIPQFISPLNLFYLHTHDITINIPLTHTHTQTGYVIKVFRGQFGGFAVKGDEE